MLPTILIEPGLFSKQLNDIYNKTTDGHKFKEKDRETLKTYSTVLFKTDDTPLIYVPLIYLAVIYQNESLLKQLLTFDAEVINMPEPESYSLLNFALSINSDKKESISIVEILLNDKKIDHSQGLGLLRQSPLFFLTSIENPNLSWIKELIAKKTGLTNDIHGANALTLSLQDEKYEVSHAILATEEGKALLTQLRRDGMSQLSNACNNSLDLVQGSALIKTMLLTVDPNFHGGTPALFSTLANSNSECRLAFIKILLENGANPNLTNSFGEHLLQAVAVFYRAAKLAANQEKINNSLEIVSLLLKHGADVFFEIKNQGSFIKNVFQDENFRNIILTHFKDNKDAREKILSIVKNNETHLPEKLILTSFFDKIHAFNLKNPDAAQTEIFELKETVAADWIKPLPKDIISETRRKVILHHLLLIFQRGNLTQENTIKLISLLDKNEDYKKYIPFLYREYLVKAIVDFDFRLPYVENKDKLKILFMFCFKLVGYFSSWDKEVQECFSLELSDIMQRIIQLALVCARHNKTEGKGLGDFLVWIDMIDVDYFDAEAQLMIWQLRMTHAYYSLNKNEFDSYYKEIDKHLPADHLLRGQYDYWNAKLVFRQIDKESLETLEAAQSKLQNRGFDNSLLTEFNLQLVEYRKKNPKAQVPKLKKIVPYIATVNYVAPPVVSASSAGTSSNNNNNRNFNSFEEPEVEIKVKQKTRGIGYQELQNNAIEELVVRIDPNNPLPVYSEEDVRKHFSDILKTGDTLKPVYYENKLGVFWAVCNFEELQLDTYSEKRFKKEFEKSNTVRFGASSGLSFKKTFRLMLGNNDKRLHSTLYKTNESTCSLIKFDELWVHDDKDIEVRTVYISQESRPNPSRLKI